MEPIFFESPEQWRSWLEKNHDREKEVWVGLYKKSSGKPSITWPEAVDEALCFGWIDGVRKSIDDDSYKNRFTPRRPRSNWSAINIKRVGELIAEGRMRPPGLKAFHERAEHRSGIYSYEQRGAAALDEAQEQQFRANAKAWEYFQERPASYRKAAIWWVVTAKKEETRARRLAQLIEDSANERTVPPLTSPK
ncbi:MAG: YdeI/OmpD-associated family protein [Actinomycetota bacterium]|nr:YdeI/OmpD-associated family protein [Actinomycetota bacterium]